MGVFAVLMVLQDPDLNEEGAEDGPLAPVDVSRCSVVAVVVGLDWSHVTKVDFMPASRLFEAHFREFLDVVHAHPGKELDLGRRVRLVVVKV